MIILPMTFTVPPELSPSTESCATISDLCAGVTLSVVLRVAALFVFLSSIPVGLVWRQDVLPSACPHGKGHMLAGSLTTVFVTGFVLLVGSDSRQWTSTESTDLSVLIFGTTLGLVFLNALYVEVVVFQYMDRRCYGDGFSGVLVATMTVGFMPMGVVLAAISLASVCIAIGLVGLVVYSLWHVVKPIFAS